MRRLAFLLALLIPCAVSARTVLPFATQESDVHIQIESCFSALPSSGYAPVEVTINNSSGRTRTWNLRFTSPDWSYFGSTQVSEQVHCDATVTVESGAARTFKFLTPLTTSAGNDSGLGVSITGYGLPDGGSELFPSGARTGKPPTPCVAVTDGASAALGKHLENAANANSQELHEAKCRADELPDDWRGLSGFAGIWLLNSEWSTLLAPQRTAVEDWVAAGGRLFLCAHAPPPPPRRMGLGSIVSVDLDSLDHAATRLQSILKGAYAAAAKAPAIDADARAEWAAMLRGDIPSIMMDDPAHWKAAHEIGFLQPNLPLLISFLAIFATVIGPLNIFVFAREGQRSRLFWTVPLISLAATCVLFVLIIIQDGFGGWGMRSALICLVPSARKAVIVQEQISRTGVLGSTSFSLRDPAWMTMVSLTGSGPPYRDPRSVENSDTHFAGEWFKSRSVQSQWIESVVPTRAEVALVNPDEAREGHAPPVIVSSISAPLSNFWFWDSKGKIWGAANVRTGVKTVLSPGTVAKDLLADARAATRRRMAAVEGAPGSFVAVSHDAASFIATLPSIRWTDRKAIYVGPVTGAEPPK
jgi:hypothetical protein